MCYDYLIESIVLLNNSTKSKRSKKIKKKTVVTSRRERLKARAELAQLAALRKEIKADKKRAKNQLRKKKKLYRRPLTEDFATN